LPSRLHAPPDEISRARKLSRSQVNSCYNFEGFPSTTIRALSSVG
jgi:hypothetical protein